MSEADGDDLLEAVFAAPDDDHARQVYADWLVERGDPLGELVHLETTLAALPPFHPDRPAFARRRTELFDAHLRPWWLAFWDWRQYWPRFHRGFIEGIHYMGSADLAVLEHQLTELVDRWLELECECGYPHHSLLRAAAGGRFPLVRRFGGLELDRAWHFAPELRLRDAVEVRVSASGADATKNWRALAAVETLRVLLVHGCEDARGCEDALALPRLAHLALERSPALVEHLAANGVPPQLRVISVEPSNAGRLRTALVAAGTPFVENAQPAAGELVLVTKPRRAPDMAFVEYPIIVADRAAEVPLDHRERQLLELTSQPGLHLEVAGTTWRLRDELAPGDHDSRSAHGLAAAERSDPTLRERRAGYPDARIVTDVGLAITDLGPVYVRAHGLEPDKPLLVVWRVDVSTPLDGRVFVAGRSVTQYRPPHDPTGGWRNWVFVVPPEEVREPVVCILITAAMQSELALYHAWFYQPA